MKKIIVFIGILALLSSCASTKQYSAFTHNSSIDNSKGRIYVVRPKGMTGAAVKTKVYCNETLIGTTGNGSYLCFDMLEGTYHIGTTQHTRLYSGAAIGSAGEEDVFVIKVTPGKTYYVKQYPRFGGFSFELMSSQEGKKAVNKRKTPKVNYAE
jgi:hypothetical protein